MFSWTFFFLLLHFIYIGIILLVIIGLLRLRVKQCNYTPSISIVVCGRNEAKRILPTLQSLEKLIYPTEKHEIILVDDASTDNTPLLMQQYAAKHEHWKAITLTEKSSQLRGKKRALKIGIEEAEGEIVFTTDADCIVPVNWLKYMVCYFGKDTSMVLGHSPLLHKKGFINLVLDFDNLFSAIVGAAPTKLGFPMTSVGRNLAYRKNTYTNIGGFDSLKRFKSGDDVHLTERFRRQAKGKIDFCAHPETFIFTMPPDSGRQLLNQQIRKNSKILNKSLSSVILSIFLFAYHALLLLSPIIFPGLRLIWQLALVSKIIIEFSALLIACRIFQKKSLIKYILFMQLFYPAYLVFFSLLGVLQIYEWKK